MAITRSPAENYIKSLVLHPDQLTTRAIIRTLDKQELDPIGPDYIDELRVSLVPPLVFHPRDPRHQASRDYLREIGIYELFHPTSDMKMAWEMLSRPSAKLRLETMLLSGLPPAQAAIALKNHGFPWATEDTVRLYRYYFFCTDMFDITQLRALIYMRQDACLRSESQEIQAQAKYLRRASYADPRLTAVSVVHDALGIKIAQYHQGVAPENLTVLEVMAGIQKVAAINAYDALCSGGRDGPLNAKMTMDVVKGATDMLEQAADPTEGIRRHISNLKLKQANALLPKIHELTAGQHTTDVSRPAEEKEEPK